MSDIKLFRLLNGRASEIQGDASDLEKPLQTLIENNLESLLGIHVDLLTPGDLPPKFRWLSS